MKISKSEIDAVMAASPSTTVAFNKLVRSTAHQVRPESSVSAQGIEALAASIKAQGILQNLVVVKGAKGMYEVCAGGRRLQALALLVQREEFPVNYPVPVRVVPAEQALLASLSENTERQPMHPADEYEAFARLYAQGRAVEDIAAAFGVTPAVVRRRMRLSNVAPSLLALYRQDQIDLPCLMALASVDDHARQEQAWAGLPAWNRRPEHLRQLLNQGDVDARRDPVALFVGLEPYRAAGGATRQDLFSDDDELFYLTDAVMLERLALDKLTLAAKDMAHEGWKWIDARLRFDHDAYARHGSLRPSARALSAAEQARLGALEASLTLLEERIEAAEDAGDDGETVSMEAMEQEGQSVQDQIDALHKALEAWSPEQTAVAGCLLHIARDGTLAIRRGLVRPEDRDLLVQSPAATGTGTQLPDAPASKATRPVHSEKLMRRLSAHRVAAIQAELLERPDVALVVLTAHLAEEVLSGIGRRRIGVSELSTISASDVHRELSREGDDLQAGRAWTAVEAARGQWLAQLPPSQENLLGWTLAQDPECVQRLLAFLVAATVTGVHGVERSDRTQPADVLANALNLDMRQWWTATGSAYLHHVSKARILEVVKESVSPIAANALQGFAKADLVKGAERAIAGSGWLPECLRTEAPAAAVA